MIIDPDEIQNLIREPRKHIRVLRREVNRVIGVDPAHMNTDETISVTVQRHLILEEMRQKSLEERMERMNQVFSDVARDLLESYRRHWRRTKQRKWWVVRGRIPPSKQIAP